jgi:hypothetical protein
MGAEAWYGPLRSNVVKSGNVGLGSGKTVVIAVVNQVTLVPLSPPACMHPFATYVLRSYYKATGWNEDNLYANFTRSSNGISHLPYFSVNLQ